MNTKINFLLLILLLSFMYSTTHAQEVWDSNSAILIHSDKDQSNPYEGVSFKQGNKYMAGFQRWGMYLNGKLNLNDNNSSHQSNFSFSGNRLRLGIYDAAVENNDNTENRFFIGVNNSEAGFYDTSNNIQLYMNNSSVNSYKKFNANKGFSLYSENGGLLVKSNNQKVFTTKLHFTQNIHSPENGNFISANHSGLHLQTDGQLAVYVQGQSTWSPLYVDDNGTFAYLRNSWVNERLTVNDAEIRFLHNKQNQNEKLIKLYRNYEQDNNALVVNLGAEDEYHFKVTNATGNPLLQVQTDNKVGIGTDAPSEALEVSGNIKANSFIADASKFPDYVFDQNYELMPLNDLENYIKQNKHLPGMPTEKEVVKNGLNVKEVSVATVEKVEELVLYILQLENRIAELEAQR